MSTMDDIFEKLVTDVHNLTVEHVMKFIDIYRPLARTYIRRGQSVDAVFDDLERHIGGMKREEGLET